MALIPEQPAASGPELSAAKTREFKFAACFVRVDLDHHWGTRVRVSAGATMTPVEARELAAAIIEKAEEAERDA